MESDSAFHGAVKASRWFSSSKWGTPEKKKGANRCQSLTWLMPALPVTLQVAGKLLGPILEKSLAQQQGHLLIAR
jgi:hypothetical protein